MLYTVNVHDELHVYMYMSHIVKNIQYELVNSSWCWCLFVRNTGQNFGNNSFPGEITFKQVARRNNAEKKEI